MKKLVSMFLALAMILAMSTAVFAEEEETFNLTIAGTLGHTYEVYQIYTGDVAEEDGTLVLSNVKYGKNHTPAGGAEGDSVPETELKPGRKRFEARTLGSGGSMRSMKDSLLLRTPVLSTISMVHFRRVPGLPLLRSMMQGMFQPVN